MCLNLISHVIGDTKAKIKVFCFFFFSRLGINLRKMLKIAFILPLIVCTLSAVSARKLLNKFTKLEYDYTSYKVSLITFNLSDFFLTIFLFTKNIFIFMFLQPAYFLKQKLHLVVASHPTSTAEIVFISSLVHHYLNYQKRSHKIIVIVFLLH